ncbi:MAG: type II secretion system F family protein [Rhodospirillales bacterium]|nr:MAG: type II secretion system F family protein [Rhodospirillales bacterium]
MRGLGPEIIVLLLVLAIPIVGAVYYFALSPAARNKRKVREKMKSLSEKERKLKEAENREMSLRRDEDRTALDKFARRVLPKPEVLRNRLEATGKPITIGKYLLASIIIGVMTGICYWLFTDYPVAAAPFLGIAAGAFLPHKYVNRLIAKRQESFVAGLAEGLDLIVRGVKSGLPVAETISVVGDEMEGPISEEFKRVTEDMRVGMTLEQALWAAAERIGTAEFKFFVVVLSVQRETGGNLSETLDNLSEMVRSRKQMKLKVKAMSSEARASQYILGGLPFAIAGLLLLISPHYIMTLWHTEAGNTILMIGGAMLAMGWWVMGRMVNFEI